MRPETMGPGTTVSDPHVRVEPTRIVTDQVILRSWAPEDAAAALEMYGSPRLAREIGMHEPVADLSAMVAQLATWDLESRQSPVPQGRWAVEDAADGRLLGGATLLPFSADIPELVMGWHLRPGLRGHGLATHIGHALAHQAFDLGDDEFVYAVAARTDAPSARVALRLGMSRVDHPRWSFRGTALHTYRMDRGALHQVRPGISMGDSTDPEGLGDW